MESHVDYGLEQVVPADRQNMQDQTAFIYKLAWLVGCEVPSTNSVSKLAALHRFCKRQLNKPIILPTTPPTLPPLPSLHTHKETHQKTKTHHTQKLYTGLGALLKKNKVKNYMLQKKKN